MLGPWGTTSASGRLRSASGGCEFRGGFRLGFDTRPQLERPQCMAMMLLLTQKMSPPTNLGTPSPLPFPPTPPQPCPSPPHVAPPAHHHPTSASGSSATPSAGGWSHSTLAAGRRQWVVPCSS
ncbi:hypothetical protein GALMADRAFT_232445 [Galerina marginata CBS 339.88]|uniref:Uncharacterized protein n=1 Tax=Galerina marginata (strain CBS 339.88) TaxID=685588 RepID=A0A067S9F3_GALM3|nr:hypothetical protein GALMADRAFT_232445 [Galerina marginata CBS 339.88]